jgi:signal transduction histidine kinase
MSSVQATALDRQALEQRILGEQIALMCKLTTLPLFGSIFIGAIFAYLAVDSAGLRAALLWYAMSLALMMVRWRVAHAFLTRQREYDELRRWHVLMLVLLTLYGALWSIPPAFMLPRDPEKEIIMSVVFIGATATGLGSLAPVRNAYAALLIPFTLPYIANQFTAGGDRILLGAAFLLYLPVMILISNRQTDSVAGQVRLAVENESLATSLRRERDRVNDTNRELQLQVEQQRLSAERIDVLNRDLETQTAELKAANKELEGFSYSVSHDLRGPLRAIDGFASLLEERSDLRESPEAEHYVRRIRENIVRMSMLIDDLLAFSRCGRQRLHLAELKMDELASTAVQEVSAAYQGQSRAQVSIGDLPAARGDRGLILQVWINLIDNAMKYSSKVEHPQIAVRGRDEPDRVVYEVSDNGVGFDDRYRGRLFGVFQRLHGQREYPGTGVGLAIVQRIIHRHGGEVWAASRLNEGATFGFALPKTGTDRMLLDDGASDGRDHVARKIIAH